MNRLQALGERWAGSIVGRTWARYNASRGTVLAGGIAYFAFFSVIPALAIGFTVLALVLGDDNELQREVAEYVNSSLGSTIIGLRSGEGIVTMDQLIQPSVRTFSAVSGFAVLVVTGLGWLDATREGIRAVFGVPGEGGNILVTKLRDLGVLATFGFAVLFSAVSTVVVATASRWVLGVLGLDGTPGAGTLVTVASSLVLAAIDSAIFLVLFRWLAGVDVSVTSLWSGAVAGGVALGLLKLSGGLLLSRLSANRFLAAFSVIVGLLVWMNLVSRVTLLAASLAATRAADAGELPQLPDGTAPERPALPVGAVPRSVGAEPRQPTYGVRAADRTTLAAGAVLGVAGAVALRAARGAVRAVVAAVRG